MSERWTAETEELIDHAVENAGLLLPMKTIRVVLTALADAGLLLTATDLEANRQYGRQMSNGRVLPSIHPDPTHYRLVGPWVAVNET